MRLTVLISELVDHQLKRRHTAIVRPDQNQPAALISKDHEVCEAIQRSLRRPVSGKAGGNGYAVTSPRTKEVCMKKQGNTR